MPTEARSSDIGVMPRLIVMVQWGKLAERKAVVEPGRSLRVGRTDFADFAVPHDAEMSKVHFELIWDGQRCLLRDAKSGGGTFLNGERVDEGEVAHGAFIKAGQTVFSVYVEHRTPPPGDIALEDDEDDEDLDTREREERAAAREREAARREKAAGALDMLSRVAREAPLFAVLDAARDERIVELCRESVEELRSLYDGVQGDALAEVAPRLVRLPAGSTLLDKLVMEGWGKRWGVYITCPLPFVELRRHLRRFLMVEDEETGEPLYFRYYDPGVLRDFLPTCTPKQLEELMGPIDAIILEGEDGEAKIIRPSGRKEA